jgi:hypothetical protein
MALLAGAMRAAALTGSDEPVNQWLSGRQLGFWGGQWGRPARGPARRRPAQPEVLASLTHLHEQGVIDDAELAQLRRRAGG